MSNLSILEQYSQSKGWYPDEDAHGRFVSNFLASEPHECYTLGLITMEGAEAMFVNYLLEEEDLIKRLQELLKSQS